MFRPICAIISLSWTHSVKARGGRGSRQPQTTRPLPLVAVVGHGSPRPPDPCRSSPVSLTRFRANGSHPAHAPDPRLSALENSGVFAFVADLVAKVVLHGPAWAGDAQDVSLPSAK
jgi:hypothetical protein